MGIQKMKADDDGSGRACHTQRLFSLPHQPTSCTILDATIHNSEPQLPSCSQPVSTAPTDRYLDRAIPFSTLPRSSLEKENPQMDLLSAEELLRAGGRPSSPRR